MSLPGDRSLANRVFLNPDERRLRAGWRLLLGAVAFVLAIFLGAIAGLGIRTALAAVAVAAIPLQYLAQFCWNVFVTGLLAGLALYIDDRTLPDLGLGGRGWWPNLAFGLVLGVVMTSVVFAVELAAGLVVVQDTFVTRPIGDGGPVLPVGVALALTFVFFAAVGVGEEVFVRGYLMTNVAEGLNGLELGRLGPIGPRAAVAAAAVGTSALFGALHLGNQNASLVSTLNITAVGLFFAAAYVATDDLGVPIGAHVTWNVSLASLWGFPVSGIAMPATVVEVRQTGDPLFTGGRFGPEAGLVLYVALAVGIALTWLWVRWRQGAVEFRDGIAVPDLRKSVDGYLE